MIDNRYKLDMCYYAVIYLLGLFCFYVSIKLDRIVDKIYLLLFEVFTILFLYGCYKLTLEII